MIKPLCTILMLISLYGCSTANSVTINNVKFFVETAVTQEEQELGLMNRNSLDQNKGMLFIFDTPKVAKFWMKNTLIPLDIIFIDESGNIINIHHDVPPCKTIDPTQTDCPTYSSESKAKYALEINASQADLYNFTTGDPVSLTIVR